MTTAEWLMNIPTSTWSRAHFNHICKSDVLVNNMNECFNSYILEARDKPIITMFECIMRKLMRRFTLKKEGMEKHPHSICPNIQDVVDKHKNLSRHCVAIYSCPGIYEVDWNRSTFVVKLEPKTCTCGAFQLICIPCPHAIAAIRSAKLVPEDFADPMYGKEMYLATYGYTIAAMDSREFWDDAGGDKINPSIVRRQTGRPKKARRKDVDEGSSVTSTHKGLRVTCKRCFRQGHNSRTCKYPIHPKSKFYKAPEDAHN